LYIDAMTGLFWCQCHEVLFGIWRAWY